MLVWPRSTWDPRDLLALDLHSDLLAPLALKAPPDPLALKDLPALDPHSDLLVPLDLPDPLAPLDPRDLLDLAGDVVFY